MTEETKTVPIYDDVSFTPSEGTDDPATLTRDNQVSFLKHVSMTAQRVTVKFNMTAG